MQVRNEMGEREWIKWKKEETRKNGKGTEMGVSRQEGSKWGQRDQEEATGEATRGRNSGCTKKG